MAVNVGDTAPDFELNATTGTKIKLSQYQGQRGVALVFIPFSFTGVCEGELCGIRDDMSSFEKEGVQVLAVTCDPGPSQAQWAKYQDFNFPMLSDFWPHGEVAKAYGAFNEDMGCANRYTFVINKEGKVIAKFNTDSLGEARDKADYESALGQL